MENASLFPHLRTSQGGRRSHLAWYDFFVLKFIPFSVQFNIGLQHGTEARARLNCLY